MNYYDNVDKEWRHACDNNFNGCGDKIWKIDDKELCTDCALEEVIALDKAEEFLFKPTKSKWKDIKDLLTILTYILTEDEIYDALMDAYKDKKDSITGHLECLNGLEECIKENADEESFLKSLGYEIIQEEEF